MAKDETLDADLEFVTDSARLLYGIDTTGYDLSYIKVKKNQTMSDIFKLLNIPYNFVIRALEQDSIFDIKRIRAGHRIAILQNGKDSVSFPDYIIYEKNLKDHVVFRFKDGFELYTREEPLLYKELAFSGTIKSSLWNALKELNLDPDLSIRLSDIYAWSIDFFGLQKGDKFSLIVQAAYLDGQIYKYDTIKAALFNHYGGSYFAFSYEQDSIFSFYDEEGNSLRKAFLKAPLRYSRISSRFSHSRLHPVLKIRRPHHGVDYAAPRGTPVHAVGDGRIIKKGWDKGGGRFIKIKHNAVYSTTYMHFSKFAKVKKGDFVKQGQVIGYVGSSGLATGPHLDFRFYKNGKAIDPLKVKSPPVQPIKKGQLPKYKEDIKELKDLLSTMPQQ